MSCSPAQPLPTSSATNATSAKYLLVRMLSLRVSLKRWSRDAPNNLQSLPERLARRGGEAARRKTRQVESQIGARADVVTHAGTAAGTAVEGALRESIAAVGDPVEVADRVAATSRV